MTHRRPTTPLDHIAHAKDTITGGADPTYAIAHALIAIAELMAANNAEIIIEATALGAAAATEAIKDVLSVVTPGGPTA